MHSKEPMTLLLSFIDRYARTTLLGPYQKVGPFWI